MATVAAIQAQLDSQGFGRKIQIIKKFTVGTTDTFYCIGGQVRPGISRWCAATNTDTAAQQATSITSAITA